MAAPGPSDRVIQIDNQSDSLTTWDSVIVGDVEGAGAIISKLQELTGSCDTEPRYARTGFQRCDNVKITMEPNAGGSPDAKAAFWEGMGTGEPRDCVWTFESGWTFTGDCFIQSCKPVQPSEDETLLEIELVITGSWVLD